MDEYDFAHDMTAEQIKLAKAAGKIAQKQVSGSTLYDAIKVGESLLVGRAVAMKAAQTNKPVGAVFSRAFTAWKKQFGFIGRRDAPLPQQYFDNCIVCAANLALAEKVIASLAPARKAGMGISGLAALVRAELNQISGIAREPRMTPTQQLREQISDLTFVVSRDKSIIESLRRIGLAVAEDSEIVVADEKKFETWLADRQPKLLTPPSGAPR
jgi:hypothetical protein